MKEEICAFLREVCPRLGLHADYMTGKDMYIVHKRGRIIQGFTTKIFFSIPKRARRDMFEPLLRLGLASNLGNKNTDQYVMERRVGKRII